MTRVFVVVALLAALLACGTSSGPVQLGAPVASASAWDGVLAEHTRRNQSYNLPTLEVDLRAALVTPRLRSAYIAARDRFHGQIANDLDGELTALGKRPDEGVDAPLKKGPDAEERVIVFASIFVRDQRYRDFSTSSSIWDVSLVRGGVRVKPLEIERVRNSPGLAGVFPFVDRFDEAYFFRFPLVDAKTGTAMMSPGGAPLTFEIASSLGTAHAEWTLTGDGVAAPASTTEGAATPSDDTAASSRLPDKKARVPTSETPSADAPAEDPAPTDDDGPAPTPETP